MSCLLKLVFLCSSYKKYPTKQILISAYFILTSDKNSTNDKVGRSFHLSFSCYNLVLDFFLVVFTTTPTLLLKFRLPDIYKLELCLYGSLIFHKQEYPVKTNSKTIMLTRMKFLIGNPGFVRRNIFNNFCLAGVSSRRNGLFNCTYF